MNIRKNNLIKYLCVSALLLAVISVHGTVRSTSAADKPAASKNIMRALYIPNHKGRSLEFMKQLVEKGKPLGINMLVIDVHSYGSTRFKINSKVIDFLKSENIFITARMVCFQDGITKLPVPDSHIKALHKLASDSADAGFDEVQLDYIRFADGGAPYPLKKKYAFIEGLLADFKKITDEKKVKLSADLFGRIVYNQNDYIGQKVEVFAPYMDAIYPMLYPSHYTGDKQRMSAPGETVKEGTLKGLNRVEAGKVAIQPYIQAFPYNIQHAKVKLDKYVQLQIKAVEETGARGWVAWNPNGDYSSVFSALEMKDAVE